MLKLFVFLFFVLNVNFKSTNCAEILAIFPWPGQSQYWIAVPYLRALVAKGHNLTVITHHRNIPPIKNYNEIIVKYKNYDDELYRYMNDDTDPMTWYLEYARNVSVFTLGNQNVQNLLNDKTKKFDLVIAEVALTESLYALGAHFKAPLIGVSSHGTDPHIDHLVGNISPLSYIQLPTSTYTGEMGLWERLINIHNFLWEWYFLHHTHFQNQYRLYEHFLPHLQYDLSKISRNFSLILLNQHHTLSFPRPNVPNMIEVGGMYYMYNPKPLPKAIQAFIDGSRNGAVYVSLGPNIRNTTRCKKNIKILTEVMGYMTERIIWQLPYVFPLPNVPSNVLVGQWFPKADILAHPKVKMFITNPDHLNTFEAIYHGKPIVGIPEFLDQFVNMARIEKLGFGIGTSYRNLSIDNLKFVLRRMLRNSSYSENAKEISRRYHDQPIGPLELALYWTEYVLRHKGAPFMQNPGKDLDLLQFFCIDCLCVIYFFSTTIFIVIFLQFIKYRDHMDAMNDPRYFIRDGHFHE